MIEYCPEHDLIMQVKKVNGVAKAVCPWSKRKSISLSRTHDFGNGKVAKEEYLKKLREYRRLVKRKQEEHPDEDYQIEINSNKESFHVSWIDQRCGETKEVSSRKISVEIDKDIQRRKIEIVDDTGKNVSSKTCPKCGENGLKSQGLQPNRFNDEQSEVLEYCTECSYSTRRGR